jgi:RNA polymerase sigma factor (sigma-70 family)
LKKELFEANGSYSVEAAYGEDHLFVRYLRRRKIKITPIGLQLYTSPRKYEQKGWVKVTVLHQYLWINKGNYDEYFQIGAFGLCIAVQRFDESRGVEFSTYASHVIKGTVLRLSRDFMQGPIKPTRIPNSSKVRKPEYVYVDGLLNENGDCYGYDLLKTGTTEDDIIDRLTINEYIQRLPDREQKIMKMSADGKTQNQIGKSLNISQAHVSRAIKSVKTKLMNCMAY